MDHNARSQRVLWSSNTQMTITSLDDDENEIKPRIENISCTLSDSMYSHTAHDFSIRLHKRKEYSMPVSVLPMDMRPDSSNTTSRFQRKCSDSFVAQTCCGAKRWTSEDVSNAISAEMAFFRKSTLVIKFPDKKVNKQVVAKFHRSIRAINFLQSPQARRCCVTLKNPAVRSDILTVLNSTRFGSGFLSADDNYEELVPAVDDIDPFTLFLDNIVPQMEKQELIDMFPNSQQITVGYTNKIYHTKRYAFIIYLTVEDAIKAFRKTNNESDVIVRFRRFSGSAHLPPESEIKKCQNTLENPQRRGLPVVTDSGPPVLNTRRNFNIVQNVTIKTEPTKRKAEIVLDDDDDGEVTNYCSNTDFDKLYENLKKSRMQISLLRQIE